MLTDVAADELIVSTNAVSFKGGLFRRVWSWNIILSFSQGRVQVADLNNKYLLRYNLSIVQLFFATSALSFVFGFSTLANGRPPADALKNTFFAFCWFFGINYLIALWRFPRWMRIGMIDVPSPLQHKA